MVIRFSHYEIRVEGDKIQLTDLDCSETIQITSKQYQRIVISSNPVKWCAWCFLVQDVFEEK